MRRSVPRSKGWVDAARRGLRQWRTSLGLPVAFCGLTLAVAGAGVLLAPARPVDHTTTPAPNPSLLAGMAGGADAGAESLDRSLSAVERQAQRIALLAGVPTPPGRTSAPRVATGQEPAAIIPSPLFTAARARALSASFAPPSAAPTPLPESASTRLRPLPAPAPQARRVPKFDAGSGVHPDLFPALEGYSGSGFGWRTDPFTGRRTFHEGIDIVAPPGTPVLAPANAEVEFAGQLGSLGTAVLLRHGPDTVTRFGHLARTAVEPGARVRRGDVIGYTGSTGRSLGPHLHYEVIVDGQKVDPNDFLLAEPDAGMRAGVPSAALDALHVW